MKNIKVTFIEPKAQVYGGQHALLQRCLFLSRSDVDFEIIHPFADSLFAREAAKLGLTKYLSFPERIPLSYRGGLWCIVRRLIRSPPSIIHVDGFDSCYLVAALKRIGIVKSRLIFTLRSDRYFKFGALDRFLLGTVDCLITNSEFSKSCIRRYAGLNALVHYSPIDFEMLQIKMDDVARRPKDGRVVISYVGALEPRKNLAFFVEVAKKILDITDKYCFHIYGDAKDQESLYYVESVMQGLDSRTLSRLSFKGYVPVQEAIVETDILICPFNNEPLGRVVPEFLYFGKTVIVSDSGGLKEAGAGYAICYVHNSVSDCVEKVLNCSGPTKNIEIIRRKLTEVFAPQGVVVKDMTVYREIGGVKR